MSEPIFVVAGRAALQAAEIAYAEGDMAAALRAAVKAAYAEAIDGSDDPDDQNRTVINALTLAGQTNSVIVDAGDRMMRLWTTQDLSHAP